MYLNEITVFNCTLCVSSVMAPTCAEQSSASLRNAERSLNGPTGVPLQVLPRGQAVPGVAESWLSPLFGTEVVV